MKKLAFKLVLCLVAVLCAAAFSSCSKKDKKALMESVPADTPFMVIFDGNQVWNQCDISVEDDDVTIGKDLEKVLKAAGVDKRDMKELKEVLRVIDLSEKSLLVFGYDDEVWMSFFVDDQEKFMKAVEEDLPNSKVSFDKDDDFMVSDEIAIKDGQVWICPTANEEIDLKQISKFMELDSDKRFTEKFDGLTAEFCADDVIVGMFGNIDEIKGMMHNSDVMEFSMVQSILFDDSKYIVGKTRLTDTQVSLEVRVLNAKMQPAKFNLPLAKIDANGMAYIDGNAPVLAAAAISPDMIETIANLLEKNNLISSSDRVLLNELKQLDGTFAMSFSNLTDFAFSQQFASEDAVKQNGQEGVNNIASAFWGTDNPFTVSAAGKSLIVRSKNNSAKTGGKVPAALVGQYAGVFIDFTKADRIVNGLDLSKLGTMYMTLGPDGDGIKFTAVWDIKAPVSSILQVIKELNEVDMNNMEVVGLQEWINIFESPAMSGYDDYAVDSVAYDPYNSYGYYEPEEVVAEEVAVDTW